MKTKKNTAAELAEAIKRGDDYRNLAMFYSHESTRARSCLHQLRQEHDELKAKHARALLDLQATLNERTRAETRLAETEFDLRVERSAHQATKSSLTDAKFMSAALTVLSVVLFVVIWAGLR